MEDLPIDDLIHLRQLREEFSRFLMRYKFGIDAVLTKVSILREEFNQAHDYNPIEHVSSRLKSPESILEKVQRKRCEPSFEAIRESITDIAGVRITCSFVADTYAVFNMLRAQHDVRVVEVKDYIASPKPNGYTSLHAIIEVPVFLSTGPAPVYVEVQIRTIAMDLWASLEHKIHYKFRSAVPSHVHRGLKEAATAAAELDASMEELHAEVQAMRPLDRAEREHTLAPDVAVVERLRQIRQDAAHKSAESAG